MNKLILLLGLFSTLSFAEYARQYAAEERNIYGRGGSDTARIVISGLPTGYEILVDGVKRAANASTVRSFVTPSLPDNDVYVYLFEIRYQDKGQSVSKKKMVSFQKGKTINLKFSDFFEDETLSAPSRSNP